FRNLLSAIARGYFLLGRTVLGVLCFSAFLIYKLRSRHLAMDHKIEEFLSEYKNHMPKRYSYWELFRMTNRFKEKLGQGGFGSVYKGKLPNDTPVAVKMLGKCKGNGQDFVNEVATIGRIHHMHVVQLTGFCAEGSKRALIYEFMPNGSLDKFLSSQIGDNDRLGWKKLHEIALERSAESSCIIRFFISTSRPIFSLKNLVPKVSDFGLAKFYPIEAEYRVLTAHVRGATSIHSTRIASTGGLEIFPTECLLMEMAGRRKNILDQHANSSSQIYFPSWIYDQLTLGDLGLGEDVAEDEKDTFKRLVIVALWCIQMKPVDRPSMSRVVEMLEGPRTSEMREPFLASPDRWGHVDDQATELGASNSFERPSSESILKFIIAAQM
ncbi:Glycerophosphodiester phosphodiesterase protein kinase domain-containing GDPDL2, partial [Ananas comosus]